jgi:hypothetical protein
MLKIQSTVHPEGAVPASFANWRLYIMAQTMINENRKFEAFDLLMSIEWSFNPK